MNRGNITITPNRIAVTLSSDGTVWMTIEEIATIFHTTATSIERYIKKVFATGELDEHKMKMEQSIVRNRRWYVVEYYDLDMIIALCFRIDTPPSKAFRRWIAEQVVRSLKKRGSSTLDSANRKPKRNSELNYHRRKN